MEYEGPEGGFSIRLNDHADDDLSEDENDTDDTAHDKISRSGLSEIPDSMSALVLNDSKVPKLTTELTKRHEKAWHAVNELVESEGRYVQKLALLDKVRILNVHAAEQHSTFLVPR